MKAQGLLVVGALSLAAAAAPAHGARAQAEAGEARVGAGVSVLDVFVLGGGARARSTFVAFGVLTGGLGLEVGYMVDDRVLVGTTLGFSVHDTWSNVDPPHDEDRLRLNLRVVPHVQVLFGTGNVRPFLGVEWGADWHAPYNRVFMAAGALGGMHGFLGEAFAISPWMKLGYYGNVRHVHAFRAGVGVSFSGFF